MLSTKGLISFMIVLVSSLVSTTCFMAAVTAPEDIITENTVGLFVAFQVVIVVFAVIGATHPNQKDS